MLLILVKYIGDNTFYGKMALELQEDDSVSPLKLRLTNLAKFISKIGYIASIIAMISYLFYMIVIINDFDLEKILSSVGIDKVEDNYNLTLLSVIPKGSNDISANLEIFKCSGKTISEALDNATSNTGRKVGLAHCDSLIISLDALLISNKFFSAFSSYFL